MRWILACLGIAACGSDVPPPPAHLENVAAMPSQSGQLQMAFDQRDSLVVMDGFGLRRLVAKTLQMIPGTESFGFGSFGTDRDGTLLVTSGNSGALARLPDDVLVAVGPQQFNAIQFPVGTPAGNYYVRQVGAPDSLLFTPGATVWVTSPLDFSRNVRAPDNTLYAIVDGNVVRFEADDTLTPIGDCTPFAGGICGAIELAGVDAGGTLFMAEPDSESLQAISSGGGALDLDLPGSLVVRDLEATATMVVLLASDPERDNELSLWMVEDAKFERITTVTNQLSFVPPLLTADHAGSVYVVHDDALDVVVLD